MVCVFCFFQLIGQKISISGYILFFVVLFYVMKSFPFLYTEKGTQMSYNNTHEILRIFNEIEKTLPQVIGNRERMIN